MTRVNLALHILQHIGYPGPVSVHRVQLFNLVDNLVGPANAEGESFDLLYVFVGELVALLKQLDDLRGLTFVVEGALRLFVDELQDQARVVREGIWPSILYANVGSGHDRA
jgi:hypothetical protein